MADLKTSCKAQYRRRISVGLEGDLQVEISGEYARSVSELMGPTQHEIREMLRDLRVQTGFSRAYVAALLGVPIQTLRKWEKGTRNPRGAARRLIWLLRCALLEPNRIRDTGQIVTWGRLPETKTTV